MLSPQRGGGDETEERKKKVPLRRKEECGMLKHCQHPVCFLTEIDNLLHHLLRSEESYD